MKFIKKGYQPETLTSGWFACLYEVVGAENHTIKQIKEQFRKEISNTGTLHTFKLGDTMFIDHIYNEGGIENGKSQS